VDLLSARFGVVFHLSGKMLSAPISPLSFIGDLLWKSPA